MPPITLVPLQYTIVDAFTDVVFGGNPASVIVLEDGHKLADKTLQLIGREFNLSETAFLTPMPSGSTKDMRSFGLRWFTPKVEVSLCGHATLASAHVLFSTSTLVPEDVNLVNFETMSGTLVARRVEDGKIELEFPAGHAQEVGENLKERVETIVKKAIGDNARVTFVGVGGGIAFEKYMLIEVDGSVDIQRADVNPGPFADLGPEHTTIIITSTTPDVKTTFISRVFAPTTGVPEDPVTGSTHCMLGPYWQKRLRLQSGEVMAARQVSERGGHLEVTWDEQKGTCKLMGKATIAARGELYMPG